jgi:hypothetical protein
VAKQDQGYRRSTGTSYSGGGGRGRTLSTYLAQTRKNEVADLYIRTQTSGILDVLGLEDDSDLAVSIKQMFKDDVAQDKPNKAEMGEGYISARADGYQARRGQQDIAHAQAAEALLGALYAATRMRERADLDEGDVLDDPATALIDGGGWADEAAGRLEVRKHVNIAIDNSGSTHMPETGYCSGAMQGVAGNLMRVLFDAASTYPGITYDGFSFNRIAIQETGRPGRAYREGLTREYFAGITVDDPLKRDAVQTNLAPLIEALYKNEEALGLIGQPRLDLILTDGEFESEKDAQAAAEWQRLRGPGVTSYVLDLCPGEIENPVELPHQFRVIPLQCLVDEYGAKAIDSDILRQSLIQIATEEVTKLQ